MPPPVDSTSAPMASSPRPSLDSVSSAIHEYDSSTALILVAEHSEHDDIDVEDPTSLEFVSSSDDDSQDDDSQDNYIARSTGGPRPSVPSLSTLAVFLYLLSPLLKLGALLSPSAGTQGIKLALPALFFFAALCAFTRQIWYMLARYVKQADMEEIALQTFARGAGRGREGERKRRWIRLAVRSSVGLLRVLLIALYLSVASDYITPVLPDHILTVVPSRVLVTLVLALSVSPLSVLPTTSLGSITVISATWASVASFVFWVAGSAYAHAHGISLPAASDTTSHKALGVLWHGLSFTAFIFATSSTLPLYSALRRAGSGFGASKPKRSRSFKLLSLGSIALATSLVLPPTISASMAASPYRAMLAQNEQPSAPAHTPFAFKCLMGFFGAATVSLGIPSLLVTAPAMPVPTSIRRHVNHLFVSRSAFLVASCALALMPATFVHLASDILMVLAFLGTFTAPALLHITIHYFHRPLSIVMPPTTPRPGASLQRSESHNDELLQRKERTLQRRRFTRRVLWDIGVWVMLLPVSGGGLIWAVGRIAGRW